MHPIESDTDSAEYRRVLQPHAAKHYEVEVEGSFRDDGHGVHLDREGKTPRPEGNLMRLGFYASLFASQLFTQASLGNVLVPLHIIGADLGVTSANQLPWFVAAYSLTVGAFILVSGRMGDLFGHKRVYVAGMAWYGLCSCLLAVGVWVKNVEYFIILRGLQGLGPAFTLPNGVALLAHAHPPTSSSKALVFSLFGAMAPLGFVLGAVVGSVFAEYVAWQYAQWSLGGACWVAALICQLCVVYDDEAPKSKAKGFLALMKEIDVVGATLGVVGLVCVTYSLNQGPISGWGTSYVIAVAVVGVVCLVAFIWYERHHESPIMPPSIWSHPGFPGVMGTISLGWGSFGIWMFYMIQLMQVERNTGPLITAAQLVPLFPLGLIATLTMSFLYGRLQVKGHNILAVSMMAFCAGSLLVALCPVSSPYWAFLFPSVLITPFGMDLSYPAGSLIISNSLPREAQGVGASMMNTVVNISIALGLGVAGTVQDSTTGDNDDPIVALQHALYVGVASSGLGIIVAVLFCRVPDRSSDSIPLLSNEKTTLQ